jgi:hypothetical protein
MLDVNVFKSLCKVGYFYSPKAQGAQSGLAEAQCQGQRWRARLSARSPSHPVTVPGGSQ